LDDLAATTSGFPRRLETLWLGTAGAGYYFTQQQTPPGQQGQASQVQTPVSQQPQSQTQQQASWQQLPVQAGEALGADPPAIEATMAATKKMNEYIETLQ
jgi:hypothetical protein